jgi:hypothetical protein
MAETGQRPACEWPGHRHSSPGQAPRRAFTRYPSPQRPRTSQNAARASSCPAACQDADPRITHPSKTAFDTSHLGAAPVAAFGPYLGHDLDSGQIRGFELDVQRYIGLGLEARAPYVTANMVLWPQFDVLFAHPARLASLTAQQRTWLQQAAEAATRDSVRLASDNATSIGQACALGARFVNASAADLAALRRSLPVVYQHLDSNPETRTFIQRIQRLKESTPAGPVPHIPAGCTRQR